MKALSHIPLATVAMVAVACSSSSPDRRQDGAVAKASIAIATAGGLTVALLADKDLETGLIPIYLQITTASGQPVTDATVTFSPTMAMSGVVEHGAPLSESPTIASDGLYHTGVVFPMASTPTGTWSATVDVTRPGATTVEVSFPTLDVRENGSASMFSYTDPVKSVTTRYVTSLSFVTRPTIGLNPIVFTLHQSQDMATFVPVGDATIVLDPQMPSMGHGSPGSVDPTSTVPGLYQGKLSLSMTGTWQTTATVREGVTTLGAPIFTTTF